METLPLNYKQWKQVFGNENDLEGNLLWLLDRKFNLKNDIRDCKYDNLYFYCGGKGSFCGLHRDTLSTRAGNLLLRGRKKWMFVYGPNAEELIGKRRLGLEGSFLDVDWLKKQDGVSVEIFEQQPGQLIVVNSNTLHQVENLEGPTSSIAWNALPVELVSECWKTFHLNRSIGISSKILFQEIIYRDMVHLESPRNSIVEVFKEMLDSQKNLFESEIAPMGMLSELKNTRIDTKNFISDFLWCDVCKAEIWNAHLVCKSCSGMLICAFCFNIQRGMMCQYVIILHWIGKVCKIIPLLDKSEYRMEILKE